jgi:hypothetical protein
MMKTQTVYRADMRREQGFFEIYAIIFRNTIRSKELIWQLFKRDFFAIYKKFYLGW